MESEPDVNGSVLLNFVTLEELDRALQKGETTEVNKSVGFGKIPNDAQSILDSENFC